jgi:hypothetical protein
MSSQAALTDVHRLMQVQIGAVAQRDLVQLWSLIDPNRLDATAPAWIRQALPVIERHRTLSSRTAAAYLQAMRDMTLGDTSFSPILAPALDRRRATTSLLTTGPVSVKRAMIGGRPIDQAMQTAAVTTARAGMRHVANGGRETVAETVKADPQARGFTRITSGNPCDFCSELADRGDVYSEASAFFAAHDGCNCSAAPAYGNAQPVRGYVARNLTPAQRSDANDRIRRWLADT